ncbi:retrotransposon hot spot (RHS) protein, putative [Trypanosoma cruzi]|uniref:Retrotransposon hot spot (RHS) protein, putative n=1 Tax=Trypanosoma cruzi (strain CL Brener) TaxID=353153 RepID=Q4DHC4_TRYCC|nr:retrotransposon hot spot (RHS) protein, putative [Trypanosoma cruzi]EAN91926.1 retrotransposon hot spot (RHS) protein, putative [Trypanosoma cruzi]|eukprot:XP_813777.1 retrotransposon hot spot (RHS) protein [Trypanosoma cruzi strain CL Brener]
MYVLEGLYESVYNARWSHVVEVTGGEGTEMEVREGKPPQSWTYKKVGYTLEKDDGVQQSGAERLKLMVLTSDKEWPYSWEREVSEFIHDCYLNCEVERVWQIVKRDLTKWFSTRGKIKPSPDPRVLIGTPGIGKSMNAGSYLLYQLLQYDAEKLQMVAYFIADRTFLFDKTAKTVSLYTSEASILSILDSFSWRGVKGYIIYDVAMRGHEPSASLPCEEWGMIVVTSPNTNNYESWAKQMGAERILINCPDESDVRAMCVWKEHNGQLEEEEAEEETEEEAEEQAEEEEDYWKKVKDRMDKVGPILRFIFNEKKCEARFIACEDAVEAITPSMLQYYAGIGSGKSCNGNHVSHKLVKVVRVRKDNIESPLNILISPYFERKTLSMVESELKQTDFFFLLLSIWDYVLPHFFEKYAVSAFLNEDFLRATRLKIEELKLPGRGESHSCALVKYSYKSFTRKELLQVPDNPSNRIAIEYSVLYQPKVKNFPLVNGFFFVDSNPMTLVGLQITTAGEHHTKTSTVRQFTEYLAAYFNDWEELSREMSWEIIYVQHKDNKPLTGWQRCDLVNSDNLSDDEKRIAAFWKEKVHQYRAAVSSADARRKKALRR